MINWVTKTPKKAKKTTNSYQMMRFTDDCGKTTALMVHRLTCLAWLEYPIDIHNYVVNHKDGNPNNNHLDNLEWCTQKQNMIHAQKEGLVKHKRVLIRNAHDGTITSYKSAGEAAKAIGVATSSIINWCRWGSDYAFRNLYQAKYETNPIPFSTNPTLIYDKSGIEDNEKDLIVIKNYHTNTTKVVDGIDEAIETTGLDRKTILRILLSKNVSIVKGFAFMYKGEQKTWPIVTDDKLPFYLYFNGRNHPVKVTELAANNVVRYFSTAHDAARYYNIPIHGVLNRLEGRSSTNVIYNMRFELMEA